MGKGTSSIEKGLNTLTKAITQIEVGVQANEDEIKRNEAAQAKLAADNQALQATNSKAATVVANFKRNILGEG